MNGFQVDISAFTPTVTMFSFFWPEAFGAALVLLPDDEQPEKIPSIMTRDKSIAVILFITFAFLHIIYLNKTIKRCRPEGKNCLGAIIATYYNQKALSVTE
jgi:hypothetical protein